jgi:hypothetical protein
MYAVRILLGDLSRFAGVCCVILPAGKQLGHLVSAEGDVMQLRVMWQGSLAGQATDTLQLVVPQQGKKQQQQQQREELLVLHEAQVDGKGSARFQEVYVRRDN